MNKPDWKDAPDWAQWLAMDSNGYWYWYETKPIYDGYDWLYSGAVMCAYEPPAFGSTLEGRP